MWHDVTYYSWHQADVTLSVNCSLTTFPHLRLDLTFTLDTEQVSCLYLCISAMLLSVKAVPLQQLGRSLYLTGLDCWKYRIIFKFYRSLASIEGIYRPCRINNHQVAFRSNRSRRGERKCLVLMTMTFTQDLGTDGMICNAINVTMQLMDRSVLWLLLSWTTAPYINALLKFCFSWEIEYMEQWMQWLLTKYYTCFTSVVTSSHELEIERRNVNIRDK